MTNADFIVKRLAALVLLVAASAIVATPRPGHAQTVLNAHSGEVVTVEATDEAITDAKARRGDVQVIEQAGGTRRTLIYLAPSDIASFDDQVTYKLGGTEKTVTIKVSEGAPVFGSQEVYEKALNALFILFILAVVIESGLQLLFRWRPYLRNFNTSGMNAVIAFAFSYWFVWLFGLDITTQLVNAYTSPSVAYESSTLGYILTAMILAGGSAGVNRVFRGLGMRPVGPPAEIAGPRDETQAWISVLLDRNRAVGRVDVLFGDAANPGVIGTIHGDPLPRGFLHYFIRNRGRFPQSGGFTVPVKHDQVLRLEGRDTNGNVIDVSWGPHPIGPRAIIDVELTL